MREEIHDEASPPPASSPPPSPRRAHRSRPLEWLSVVLLLPVLLVLGGLLALLVAERSYGPRIHPNISIRGTSVGGLTVQQAQERLQRRYADFLRQPVELTWNNQRWQPPLEQLGVSLAIDEAVHAAAQVGWSDSRLENARTVAATLEQGMELPLRVRVDQRQLQNYLLLLAHNVEAPATNAALALNGSQLTVTPERFGTQLLVDETARDIIAALQSLAPQHVALRTRQLAPLVRDSDVAPVAAELHTMLEGPLVLRHGEQRWEWPAEQIARWVSLRANEQDGRLSYHVTFDANGPRRALLPVATALRQEGQPPRVDWNGGDMRIT
ncbi:MAG: peptidoglycan binding domain-containing protein, partial [Chloroflexaceae bacterium]|nr:peptidoglycan binding domain-containing protein [Chloroflexaceae bacterium]